jgi:hypothetical protein
MEPFGTSRQEVGEIGANFANLYESTHHGASCGDAGQPHQKTPPTGWRHRARRRREAVSQDIPLWAAQAAGIGGPLVVAVKFIWSKVSTSTALFFTMLRYARIEVQRHAVKQNETG